MAITIHPELQSLIPPLTTEEYTQLEANIRADGCHDPLLVWQEEQTLLDGHHRYESCERHGLAYRLQDISLPDLDAAKLWMLTNQLGRRNLTPDQMRYYRGKQYHLQKKVRRGGGDRKSAQARDQKPHNEAFDTTAQALAVQPKVSKATIERDAVYATAIDTIAAVAGPEVRHTLLGRDAKVTQQEVKQLAHIATTFPRDVPPVLEAVQAAKPPKQARKIVREAVHATRQYEQRMAAMVRSELGEEAGVCSPPPASVPEDPLARLLTKALESLRQLYNYLVQPSSGGLPLAPEQVEALAQQPAVCRQLGEYWRPVESALTASEAFRAALPDPPPAGRPPAAPRPASRPKKSTPQAKHMGLAARIDQVCLRLQQFTCAEIVQQTGIPHQPVWKVLDRRVQQHRLRKEGLTYSVVDAPGVGGDA
jgi:hypothetical protein